MNIQAVKIWVQINVAHVSTFVSIISPWLKKGWEGGISEHPGGEIVSPD